MKVTAQTTVPGQHQIHLRAPVRPTLGRAHSDTDSFCRSKHGRPQMQRRSHSSPRVPKPQARVKTAAQASTFSADVGISARSVWTKALSAAVKFAEYFIGVLLEAGMARVGQRFAAPSAAATSAASFGVTGLPINR